MMDGPAVSPILILSPRICYMLWVMVGGLLHHPYTIASPQYMLYLMGDSVSPIYYTINPLLTPANQSWVLCFSCWVDTSLPIRSLTHAFPIIPGGHDAVRAGPDDGRGPRDEHRKQPPGGAFPPPLSPPYSPKISP